MMKAGSLCYADDALNGAFRFIDVIICQILYWFPQPGLCYYGIHCGI